MVQEKIDGEDVVLLILESAERLLGNEVFRGITRLEKLIFLFSHESKLPELSDEFAFRAYKYGPFSSKIYDAVDFLQGLKLVATNSKSLESTYSSAEQEEIAEEELEDDVPTTGLERTFSLTDTGRKAANALRLAWSKEHPKDLATLDEIVTRIGGLPLNQVIRYVYRRHPNMAQNSIHPEAQHISPSK